MREPGSFMKGGQSRFEGGERACVFVASVTRVIEV
jgi:hypothetical protein